MQHIALVVLSNLSNTFVCRADKKLAIRKGNASTRKNGMQHTALELFRIFPRKVYLLGFSLNPTMYCRTGEIPDCRIQKDKLKLLQQPMPW